ncbi:MAG TPA: hypothetical protein VF163_11120 [Micromonosporaceae bacterium]
MPQQFTPVPAVPMGPGDPLVLLPGAGFGAWFSKVQEIAKRSWKSALIITTVGIAAPRALTALIQAIAGGADLSITSLRGSLVGGAGSLLLGLFVTVIATIVACYLAAAGWAAGTWALVHEASTGQRANLGQAFSFGFKRAMALFPWTIVAGIAVGIGSACFVIPGLYLAFGFSMFGFVALFERGTNPIGRSFGLTHNSATFGPTVGKVAILLVIYLIYTVVVGAIFAAITLAVAFGTGGFLFHLTSGLLSAIAALLSAPAIALLLIGLLPTYAELRAREVPLSTPELQRQLLA